MHIHKPLAQGLASLGRGNDSMLVHMSPREVAGLQKLALASGGTLTINPHTGLPEAGWLDQLLPMVAGAAAIYFSGGTATPLVSGLMSAGAGAVTKGAVTKDWSAGNLASGALSGYGGGALTSGLAAAGGAAAQNAAAQGVAQGAGQAAAQGVAQGAGQASLQGTGQFAGAAAERAAQSAAPSFAQQAVQQGLSKTGIAALPEGGVAGTGTVLGGVPQATYGAKIAAGAKGLGTMKGWSDLGANMTPSGKMAAATSTMGVIGEAGSGGGGGGHKNKPNYYVTEYHPGTMNPNWGQPGEPYFLGQGYDPGYWTRKNPYQSTVADAYFVEPGYHPPTASTTEPAPLNPKFSGAEGGEIPDTDDEPDDDEDDQQFAAGGIASLYRAGGKLLNGRGDGMSDSIPAVIQGPRPQKAALADGEFVMPADVVSHLGNGSTKAGSKQLYAMMDRVRKARTGTTKQGKKINPSKFMPA